MLVALENFFLASCEEKYERWENISSYHYYINLTLISSLSFLVFEIHTKALSENCVERVRRARKTKYIIDMSCPNDVNKSLESFGAAFFLVQFPSV